MKPLPIAQKLLSHLDPRIAALIEQSLARLPFVRDRIKAEQDRMLQGMEASLKPYRGSVQVFDHLPAEGMAREDVIKLMTDLQVRETPRWKDGFASGAVYHGDEDHTDFLNEVYALYAHVNPLHTDLWPSATKFEAEIVAMTAKLLGADRSRGGDPEREEICGTVTSGGTESILMAMKSWRDHARAARGIRHPEIVAPVTAHAAFDKASQYFGIKLVKVPVDREGRVLLNKVGAAIGPNTAVIVGSAPNFPYGVVDPIAELSGIAQAAGVGLHVDACLGGFLLPWAERLGWPVPAFDFRLAGVGSISVDTHKYGYAAKGTSVVLYRGLELRRYQYFVAPDWPGGLYASPTMAGSRPGALSAACWAAMVSLGEDGYLEAARRICETSDWIRARVAEMPELRLIGESRFVVAFESETLNVYEILERLSTRGWNLNGLHKPAALHLCVTLRHTRAGVKERFIRDLEHAVAETRANPEASHGMAPVYGLASSLPFRGIVRDLLARYLDVLYRP